jgi:L-alanine-DL-glutamate epimerase-like enolase superfamily enzyme
MPIIEKIETIPIKVPLKHLYKGSYYKMRNRCTIITRITTSDGIVGQSYNADTDEEQHEVLGIIHDEIAPAITGMDSRQIEKVWHAMLPVTFIKCAIAQFLCNLLLVSIVRSGMHLESALTNLYGAYGVDSEIGFQ